jgi:putative DNA primase/helicase
MEEVAGKPTKVLYQPDDPARRARSNDPKTWADADTALEVAEIDGFDGIGFQLLDGELGALDLDHCRNPDTGEIVPWVSDLVAKACSYTEITPSKTGLRIIGVYSGGHARAMGKRPIPGANGATVEAYPPSVRYITVTGDRLDGTPNDMGDITAVIDGVIAELGGKTKTKAKASKDDAGEDDGELPASLTKALYIPDGGAGKAHAGYASRNELLFAFIADALRARIGDERIAAACLDPAHRGHAIYEHCEENGGRQYAERQIQQARAKVRVAYDDLMLTDLGNARRLVASHGPDMRYVPTWKSWMTWVDGHWRRDEDGAVVRMAKATVELMHTEAAQISDEGRRTAVRVWAIKSQSQQRLAAMVKLAESELEVVAHVEQLDADPLVLGVRNGVVDLRNGTFRAARREDYVTKIAGVAYDARAECPNWVKFLATIFDSEGVIQFLMRAVGYCLTGLTVEEVLFVLVGTGANGKTTFRETIYTMMGDYAVGSDASLLVTSRRGNAATPDIARLHGRRIVTINETEESDELSEQRMKFITGNDVITARNLYEKLFDFRPTHKSWLTTNHRPIVKSGDEGTWRRIVMIEFLKTIAKKDRVVDFRETRLTPELPGILNWALRGLKAYRANGLVLPDEVTVATDDYREDMDIIGRWLKERCAEQDDIVTASSVLYDNFAEWSREELGWLLGKSAFGRKLAERGYKRSKIAGDRGWRRLFLKM